VAAGKIGACNPLESGFNHFWPSSFGGPSSFLLVLKEAGHATFNDAGRLGNKLGDWLCGRGGVSRETAIGEAGAAMVSWFDSVSSKVKKGSQLQLLEEESSGVSVALESDSSNDNEDRVRVLIQKRPAPAPRDAAVPSPSTAFLQVNFYSWARAAAAAGQVGFEVRGAVEPPVPVPQPEPCPSKGTATATTAAKNNAVPFPAASLSSSSKKGKEEAAVVP
jgi:hypothetical protein